jgi:hypothetical protein
MARWKPKNRSKGSDRIYWIPQGVLDFRATGRGVFLIHMCPLAVVIKPVRRDELDPMALGECRYCFAPLPTVT